MGYIIEILYDDGRRERYRYDYYEDAEADYEALASGLTGMTIFLLSSSDNSEIKWDYIA